MRLVGLLMILIAAVCISSCKGKVPPRPSITLCVIDYPAGEAICGETDPHGVFTFRALRGESAIEFLLAQGPIRRVPLAELDRASAIPPRSWETLMNYLWEVEQAAGKDCKLR